MPRKGRKKLSHCRSKFPSGGRNLCRTPQQRTGKLEADQVVALGVRNPHGAGAKGTGGPRQRRCGGQRGAGDLEQNLRGWRQGAAHSNKGSPGANVESGGKLKKFLALVIPTTDEYRDGKGQAGPLATFFFGSASDQGDPLTLGFTRGWWHLRGQIGEQEPANTAFWPKT